MRWNVALADAGECSDATSGAAPAVRVAVTHRLRRAPRRSSAAAFHRVPAGSVTFYGRLTVHHPELSVPMAFCLQDRHHGALVSHCSTRLRPMPLQKSSAELPPNDMPAMVGPFGSPFSWQLSLPQLQYLPAMLACDEQGFGNTTASLCSCAGTNRHGRMCRQHST